jgi:hypothetical protein
MSSPRTRLAVLLTCVTALATPAFAVGPGAWVPVRWPGGPLEIERRARDGSLPDSPALRETIRQWYDLATLDLLRDTPVNCLLVTWSAGAAPDVERAQQQLVAAYARAARARGIAVLGVVHGPAETSAFLQPAIDAGLDGLVLEGAFPDAAQVAADARRAPRSAPGAFVVVTPSVLAQASTSAEIAAITDALAPGLQELSEEAEASPSAEPWIDSNLWLVQSAGATRGSGPIWLMQALPAQAAPHEYLRAIADAAAAGGRWVVALGDDLRHGLRSKQADAAGTWRQVSEFLRFQQDHAEWFRYPPLATAAFVQDSAGADRDTSATNLRLTVRARVPVRVVERARLDAAALAGVRAVHAIDVAEPTALERKVLAGFAEGGGVLLAGPSWHDAPVPAGQDVLVVPSGKGRLAVAREGLDPSELARSLVDLLGRDALGVRLFRASAVLGHASVSDTGREALVHLVNYASYPAESMLVRVNGDFQNVRLYTPGSAPQALALDRAGGRVEVRVERLPVYGILRFER